MIKLFCGPESAEKNSLILKMISESCARAIDASKDKDTASRDALSEIEPRRVCLIVPEQQAVIWGNAPCEIRPSRKRACARRCELHPPCESCKASFRRSFLQQRRTGGSRSADVEGYRIGRAASARIRQ